jgi:hypothetical protein
VLLAENRKWLSEEGSKSNSTREEDTTTRGEEGTKRYGVNVVMRRGGLNEGRGGRSEE